jgi:hypothetical protein
VAFYRQLLKRYGIVLGVGQFSKIVMDIRSGRATLIKASRGSRGLYMVYVKGAGRVYVLAVNGQPRMAWPVRHAKRLLRGQGNMGNASCRASAEMLTDQTAHR